MHVQLHDEATAWLHVIMSSIRSMQALGLQEVYDVQRSSPCQNVVPLLGSLLKYLLLQRIELAYDCAEYTGFSIKSCSVFVITNCV